MTDWGKFLGQQPKHRSDISTQHKPGDAGLETRDALLNFRGGK
jgi:hypothetical protein